MRLRISFRRSWVKNSLSVERSKNLAVVFQYSIFIDENGSVEAVLFTFSRIFCGLLGFDVVLVARGVT